MYTSACRKVAIHIGTENTVTVINKVWNLTVKVARTFVKVKSIQISGTKAIRTQIQPSKPKKEITKITNSQNTKRTYDQPSEQLFPIRWSFSNSNRTKNKII